MNDKQALIALLTSADYYNPMCYTHEDVLDRLAEHLIAHGVTVRRWVPVEERLPTYDDADSSASA